LEWESGDNYVRAGADADLPFTVVFACSIVITVTDSDVVRRIRNAGSTHARLFHHPRSPLSWSHPTLLGFIFMASVMN